MVFAQFEWVTVPVGDYTYGQGDTIKTIDYDFEIMKYEVTNEQYVTYMEEALTAGEITVTTSTVEGYYTGDEHYGAGTYEFLDLYSSACRIDWDGSSFSIITGYEEHPVIEVTWFGSWAFAEHSGLRLPIEHEWEKAARGNTGYDYPWGNNIDGSRANYWNSGDPFEQGSWAEHPQTTPAGFYNGQNYQGFQTTDSPSPYVAYDMAGNLLEWTDSWWSEGNSFRVVRGGSWDLDTYNCRSWNRDTYGPYDSDNYIGFRCARTFGSGTGVINVPGDYSNIQEAINASTNGDSVLVAEGTYVENINYNGKNIVVKSESGPEVTIIDGNQDTSVVIFNGGETSTAVLSGFTIQNGRAGDGGGIYCFDSSPTLKDLIISWNTTSGSPWGRGGGIYCRGKPSPTLSNIIISSNTAGEGGGVFCLSSSPALDNVTLSGNSASSFGGGISIYNGSHPILVNSILWNNSTPEICFHGTGDPNSITVTYSDVQYGQDSIVTNDNGTIYWEEGNIDSDPLFVDTTNSDYHLSDYSPCIGAGADSVEIGSTWYYAPDTDIEGNPRPNPPGSNPDMGAYESQMGVPIYLGPIWHVSTTGNDITGNGSEDYPFATIQYGIDATSNGDTVLVAMGTYYENLGLDKDSVTIGSQYLIDGDTTHISSTIIDGNGQGRVLEILSDNVKIIGFTIKNGFVDGKGAGIIISGYSPYILSCIFQYNNTTSNSNSWGGGIYLENAGVIEKCTFSDNYAREGGGLVVRDDISLIYNCTFDGNNSDYWCDDLKITSNGNANVYIDSCLFLNSPNGAIREESGNNINIANSSFISCKSGIRMSPSLGTLSISKSKFISCGIENGGGYGQFGAISGSDSYIEIEETLFKDNISEFGGALHGGRNVNIDRCIFISNSAINNGGAIYSPTTSNDSLSVSHCTFYNNSASSGNAVYNYAGYAFINSSILYNTQSQVINGYSNYWDRFIVTYSLIHNWGGLGNISAEPLFVDPDNSNFNLQWGSPAIDAGDPTSPLDPDGTRADMGAYYFDQTDPTPPTIAITNLSSTNVGTEDDLTVSWDASDNWILDSAFVDIFYSDEEVIRVDTTMAETGQSTIEVPDNTLDPFQLIVTVWDYNHNEAADTSEVITVFDNTRPVVTVLSPSEGFSVPENEEIIVTWTATDNIEMDTIAVYYSDDGGQMGSLMGIVSPDSTAFTFSVPSGVTDSAEIRVKARDIYMNTGNGFSPIFTVTDNTPPTVELLTPQSGTELEIASFAELTWDATDNVGVTSIDLYYSVGDGSSWATIVEGEENIGLYLWPVPNSPSDQVVLRLIGYDSVGLSDTSDVTGLSITIVYPTVTAIDPPPGLLTWRESQLTILFSQAMNPIDDQAIAIRSGYSDSVIDSAAFSYVDTSHTLVIEFPSGFASLDTITITLQAIGISNIYGYQLDGNGDGQGGDDYIFQYNSSMLADYDTSDTLDLLDLAQFVQALEDDDYTYELGPVSGTAPHFISSPDSMFDIEDVMAFVMMWNWYVTTRSSLFHVWSEAGCPVNIETTPDSIFIDIPEGVLAYEVQIKYNPKDLLISNPSIGGDISLNNNDEEAGIYTLITTPEELNKIALPIAIKRKEADISFSFRAAGYDGEILSQLTRELNIVNIPREFALHQNYPNPFNPITTIEYDLPRESYVSLIVFDLLGRQVKQLVNGRVVSGYHQVIWNSTDDYGQPLGSGMYFYRIQAGEFIQTRKMVLLK